LIERPFSGALNFSSNLAPPQISWGERTHSRPKPAEKYPAFADNAKHIAPKCGIAIKG
jgi:hypothetical protein